MSELTAEQKARAMMSGAAPAAVESAVWEAHVQQKVEALRARGVPHGLSPAQVAASDAIGMSLARYSAYKNVLTITDAENAERKLKADEEALAQAERELAVAAAKAELR